VIDIHNHILPGLDHGARDWDEAMEMCRIAADDGITLLAATPHVSDVFPNDRDAIETAVDELRERVAAADLPLEIVGGGDYHINPDLTPETVITLGGNGRYFLLEFPYQVMPPNSDLFVASLVKKGLTPVVTHPERIYTLHGYEQRLETVIAAGALVQITAASLTGEFGPESARSAAFMLRQGWAHVIASDSHWAEDRPPVMSEGLKIAAGILGTEAADSLVNANPRAIIDGKDIVRPS